MLRHPYARGAVAPIALALGLALVGCNDDDDPVLPTEDNLVEVLEEEGFNTLLVALDAVDLDETLEGPGTYTVFAPTDEAFEALPEGALDDLLEDPDALGAVLLYHVVEGRLESTDLDEGQLLITVEGRPARITLTDGPRVNQVDIIRTDIDASNGVIHAIAEVLIPVEDNVDTAIERDLESLVSAVQEAGLEEALRGDGPFTVFAPSDEAFAALPEGALDDPDALEDVLLYHVVEGRHFASDLEDGLELETLQGQSVTVILNDAVQVDDAVVTEADILTSNGVIHIIDAVLEPDADDD